MYNNKMQAPDYFWQGGRFFVFDILRLMKPVEHDEFYRVATCTYNFECHKAQKMNQFEIVAGEYKTKPGVYLFYLTDLLSGLRHKIIIDKTNMRKTIAVVENFYLHDYVINFIVLGFCALNEMLEVRYKHMNSTFYMMDEKTSIEIPSAIMLMGSGFFKHAALNPFFIRMKEIKRFVDVCNVRLDAESLCIADVSRCIYEKMKGGPFELRDYLFEIFRKKNIPEEKLLSEIVNFFRDVSYIYNETEHIKVMSRVSPQMIKTWVYYDGLQ